jgi:hypothetical protein
MYFSGNPFEKRATEFLKDASAFLGIVSPEPLITFFEDPAAHGALYDRLVTVVGAPGSGKTTIAKLFQFDNLHTLIASGTSDNYSHLYDALRKCRAIADDDRPAVVGCRLPMESEYRDFWELPYPDEVKLGLMTSLLQARSVIAWLRMIVAQGYDLHDVTVIPKSDATAALSQIGGEGISEIAERARAIELAIYRISSALIPPSLDALPDEAIGPYYPWNVLEGLRLRDSSGSYVATPLVVLDDAHTLHREQLSRLQAWLARREIPVARWLQMRFDALTESAALYGQEGFQEAMTASLPPQVARGREVTEIWMQPEQRRGEVRLNFRKMARDMASRYLRLMPVFTRRRLDNLGSLLSSESSPMAPGQVAELREEIDTIIRTNQIAMARVNELKNKVDEAIKGGEKEDVAFAMLRIALHRYINRVPQVSFLQGEDAEPNRPIQVGEGILEGARVQLLNQYNRPYYYTLDTIADASSENAEQFLHLSSQIVANLETQLIRNQAPQLSSELQHRILVKSAAERIGKWSFPESRSVRTLVDYIGAACNRRTMEPSAPLNQGANAIGIPSAEFEKLTSAYPDLARVLKYAIAYNALSLKRDHVTKDQKWCLLGLSGLLCIHYKLSLKRGGFVDTVTLRELARVTFDEH